MDRHELEQLLRQLRRFDTDHQRVEAKRARTDLPDDLWETFSAFANSEGGLILLGVHEEEGFSVTGVENPERISAALEGLDREMEPPLRPRVELVDHPDGVVVAVRIPSIPRDQRPCHRRRDGPRTSSFIRVGDGNHQLTRREVQELLSTQRTRDHSARPAQDGALLDPNLTEQFCRKVRVETPNLADAPDEQILRGWKALSSSGEPTLAGVLALGANPAGETTAARLAYRVQPEENAVRQARFSGEHIEGTVGEILDATLSRLEQDLTVYQVDQADGVVDVTDVPQEVLREIVGNALMHRSFTEASESQPVVVEVSGQAVRVISPGGLHHSVDPESVGVEPTPGVRNLALVRLCGKLKTPSGHRIVEAQGSGIHRADFISRKRGTAPPLFADHPAKLEVLLLRGGLPEEGARELLEEAGVEAEEDDVRLVSWAIRRDEIEHQLDPKYGRAAEMDVYLAARLLVSEPVEGVAARLTELKEAGVLRQVAAVGRGVWILAPQVAVEDEEEEETGPQEGRVVDVLEALRDEGGEASRATVQVRMGLESNKWASELLNRAMEADLVESTTESIYHPNRAYRLTRTGEEVLARERP